MPLVGTGFWALTDLLLGGRDRKLSAPTRQALWTSVSTVCWPVLSCLSERLQTPYLLF